ncbi:MAG: hypothetical protein QXG03_13915 [Halalkalicoccus sp.]
MEGQNTAPELTVYLRSSAPFPARDRQEEVIERAERLATEGRIGDVSVRHWNDRVVASDEVGATDAVETFEAFKSRAEEIGHTIEPFFQEHDRGGVREIVFPIICIAVYVDEELRRVFPCRDDREAYSVWDCLTALETDGAIVGLGD